MFYLYIDEVLVSQSADFNEIYNFIFDYYFDIVKDILDKDDELGYCARLEKFDDTMRDLIYGSLHGLILHQFDSFNYFDHEVMVYYGYGEK